MTSQEEEAAPLKRDGLKETRTEQSKDSTKGAADLETWVPEGDYHAIFERCEVGVAYGSEKYFAHFRITDGEHQGEPLVRFYNKPTSKKLARSHNMFSDYLQLIGRRPPSKLKPADFLSGCEVKARVVTVDRRQVDGRWASIPDDARYSKIDRLLSISSGWPPGVPQKKTTNSKKATQTFTHNANKNTNHNGNRIKAQ
jgi:hypothetical protein